MIKAKDLIRMFQAAIDDRWGYIYGKKHEMWSADKQAAYAREYAGDPDRENSVRYGGKWVGHWVTDCSGLFAYSYEQLGGSIAHGSNSIWDKYCSAQGTMTRGKRTDGQGLKPGTAVFTSSGAKHNHIGLYIGNGVVIEAQGAEAGVVTSKASATKWTHWGELKGVSYDDVDPSGDEEDEEEGEDVKEATVWSSNGKPVKLRASNQPGTKMYGLYDDIPVGTIVEVTGDDGEWSTVNYGSRRGWYMKSEFLVKDGSTASSEKDETEPQPSQDKVNITLSIRRTDAEVIARNLDALSWQIIQQIGGLG